MSIMHIEGKELFYETLGDKSNPCICFLHGGPGATCIDFIRPARILAEKFFIVLIDQYGCGRSGTFPEGSDEVFGMPQHLKQIEYLRKELGIKQWIIVGHSYGGMLAAYYANQYPDSISAVIYECPSWNFSNAIKSIASYYIDRYYNPNNDRLGIELSKRIMNTDYSGIESQSIKDILNLQKHMPEMKTLFYVHGTTVEDIMSDFAAIGLDEREVDAAAEVHMMKIAEEGTFYQDFLPMVAENKQPALLLCGAFDPCCTPAMRLFFNEKAPNGRMITFDGCGHWLHLEDKEGYTGAIENFILDITK